MRLVRPPRRRAACPDCRGKVEFAVRSRTRTTWRCRDLRCATSGSVLPDGHLAVAERYRVLHPLPLTFQQQVRKHMRELARAAG